MSATSKYDYFREVCLFCRKDTKDVKCIPAKRGSGKWVFLCGDLACAFQRRTENVVISHDEYTSVLTGVPVVGGE